MTLLTVDIRERTPDQLDLWVDILNAALPADAHVTLDQQQLSEASDSPESPPMRLLAWVDDEAVATGYAGRKIYQTGGRAQVPGLHPD